MAGAAIEPCRAHSVWGFVVLAAAVLVAVVSAHSYAGSWNDGSRLATVECLVDYHTLAIDRSIFVDVPPRDGPTAAGPYPEEEPVLWLYGTCDKLWIGGHFYSDKPPVPALFMAGWYQVVQAATGLTARARPDAFCYWMTVGSSGLAYVLAVYCLYQLGGLLGLALPVRLGWTASFALATVALPYARHVNNHILLLAIGVALLLQWSWVVRGLERGRVSWLGLLGLGTLAGLGYTTDLGAGPVLLVCTLALVACRCRRFGAVALVALAAVPWLALHHTVNYLVGGTLKPANAVPEYFAWPGCPFDAGNMTGAWHARSPGHLVAYAVGLLVGKRGFLGHNPALLLAVAAGAGLLRRRRAAWPELLFAAGWCGGTWLLYALTSNNGSGTCCSVRWFVPFLAPGYYVLALVLRQPEAPATGDWRWVFWVLSGWGAVLGGIMWWQGPWLKHMVPFFWPIQAACLLTVLGGWLGTRRQQPREIGYGSEAPQGQIA